MEERKPRKHYEYNRICTVLGCSSTQKNSKCRFFKFPKKNKGKDFSSLALVWSVFTRRKNFEPTPNTVMCEKHFDPELIQSVNKKKKERFFLPVGAVPTIYYKDGQKIVVPYDKTSEQYYGYEAQNLLIDTENFVEHHEQDIANERLQKIKRLKSLCRFCFIHDSETARTVEISKLQAFSVDIQEMLCIIGINSEAEDLFSDVICENCFTYVVEIENYRKRCRKAQQECIAELEELDKRLNNVRLQRSVQRPVKSEFWFNVKMEPDDDIIMEEEFNDQDFQDTEEHIEHIENEEHLEPEEYEVKIEEKLEDDQNWEGFEEIVEEEEEEEEIYDNVDDFDENYVQKAKKIWPKKDYEKIVENQQKYHTEYALRTFECFWCKERLKGYAKFRVHLKTCKREVICDVVGCRKVFTNQGMYNSHIMNRHKMEKITRYFCIICNVNHQTTKSKFEEHAKKCLEENKFKEQVIECGICKKTFKSLHGFAAHKMFHGREDEKLAQMVQTKRGLKKGGSTATPKKEFMCDICGKIFSDNSKLRRHKVDVHFVDFKGDLYYCDLCPVAKETKRLIYTHMKSSHIIKEHPCAICGKIFRNRELWRKHQLIHNGAKRNNLCHICPHQPGFVTTSALKKHHWKHHGGLQPVRNHICDLCGTAYSLAHLLVRHKIKVHDMPREKIY